ncbi:MAG: enoyl-CoA hydratase/isomerase family protein [Dehalococcoidales bacterium]|nr:enoyl-CoA hydratase/isomerase family protein [Dehalococcoidales bacterium]
MLKFKKFGKFDDVILEKSGYVARITLNDPDTMNTGVKDFWKALSVVEQSDDIKVLIIKGAGRALAAGAPLHEVGFVYGWKAPKSGQKMPKTAIRSRIKFDRNLFYECAMKLLFFPKITVVQAHGFLLGASMDMYMLCDFIVGAEDCKFGEIEVRLGIPQMTITPIMILRVGLTNALDMCLTGRMMDGTEAARIGLINRAVPADKLEETVNNYAEGFSKFPFDGIALGKTSKQMVYDMMNITSGLSNHFLAHTMGTNIHFEEDEFNFFKARRDMGVRDAIHARNKLYEQLDK